MPSITYSVNDVGCSPNEWYLDTVDKIQVSMDYVVLNLADCLPSDISYINVAFKDGTECSSGTDTTTLNNVYTSETMDTGTNSSTLAGFLDTHYFNTAPKTVTARNSAIASNDVRGAGVKIFDGPGGSGEYILVLGSLAKNDAGVVNDYAIENIEIEFSPTTGTPTVTAGNSIVATYFSASNCRVGETKAVV